ncbi:MAG: sulfotransferase family protein [Candidatus Heimdallarchaeota archaeon]
MKDHWIINRCTLGGASTSNIWRILIQNKFRVHPKYWPRLWYSMALSGVTAPLRMIERLRFNRKVKKHELTEDPIFIIGHWRSGTTFMHYMFAKDKNNGLVTNVETYTPHFFLAFPKFTTALIDFSLPDTRPMDEIIINAELPGEEEHSMGAFDKYGFFHGQIFIRNAKTYTKYLTFEKAKPKDLARWKKRYQFFIKKMAFKNKGKRLILKNPANTYRVKHLIEMYPNAKFIHLYRNPYEVYSSSLKFHFSSFKIFALQTWDDEEVKQNVLDIYKETYEGFEERISSVPKENWLDVCYEDFIKKPLETMELVHSKLNISGFEECKPLYQEYLDENRDYQPRVYNFSDELINRVNDSCDFILKKFNYEKLKPTGNKLKINTTF